MRKNIPAGYLLLLLLAALASSCESTPDSRSSSSSANTAYYGIPAPPSIPIPPALSPHIPAPAIVGKSAIVVDARTGKVLHKKNDTVRRPVASTQKLLTSLVVLESGNIDKYVTVAKTDTYVEPSKLGISAGERYSRRQLLQALLVKSGNDVARCLARDNAGSQENFARAMNRYARHIGMYNSNFVNANGLPAAGQVSTARDISMLAIAALNNPYITPITRIKSYTFRFSNGRTRLLTNTNKLLKMSPYCSGMKTGYTRASGRCLVSSGTYNGRTVIVVVLGSTTGSIWNDSKKLLHWGLGIT